MLNNLSLEEADKAETVRAAAPRPFAGILRRALAFLLLRHRVYTNFMLILRCRAILAGFGITEKIILMVDLFPHNLI